MNRRLPLFLVAGGLLTLVLFPFFRTPDSSRRRPAVLETYEPVNVLRLSPAPAHAYLPAVQDDLVERIASRLEWAPPEVVGYTQRHLPEDPETRRRLARRLEQTLARMASGTPLGGRRFVETLGVLADPESIPIILGYARTGPDYLQTSAIQALSHLPASGETTDVLALLSGNSNPHISQAAEKVILGLPEYWTRERVVSFLEVTEDSSVNRMLEEVGLMGLDFAADAVADQLDSENLKTRQVAVRTLLRLRDPRGTQAGVEELRSGDEGRILAAITLFRDAAIPPPEPQRVALAAHPLAQVRQVLASTLGPRPDEPLEEEPSILVVLERLADDADAAVRRTAVAQLFRRGRFIGLESYRDDLRQGHGDALKESVQFLCEKLRDPEAARLIRTRLESETEARDAANLLFGLRFVGDVVDADHYIANMLAAGTLEDSRAGGQLYLSEYASLYVQDFGSAIAPRLVGAYANANTRAAKLMLLDALRGVAAEAGPESWDFVVGIVTDRSEEPAVRVAAAESLPFFDDVSRADQIQSLSREVENRQVATRLVDIFLNYF